MTFLGFALTLVFCLLVMTLSRRGAVLAIIATVCYLTQGQELNIGLHFTSMRLVLLAAMLRVMMRGELMQMKFNRVDGALVIYVLYMTMVAILRDRTSAQISYQVGFIYNAFMSYFVIRALLTSEEDLRGVLNGLPWLMTPLAMLMVREVQSGSSPFAVFGGLSLESMVRDGQVRASGAFRTPITAGSFGATFAVMYCVELFRRGLRFLGVVGLVSSLVVILCAHSSGPLMGLAVGLGCLALWPFRAHTRFMRRGLLFGMVGLHLVMKAPVWFLFGRISDLIGGGGYHRAYLIDTFIRHFSDWWLVGTNDTSDWLATKLVIDEQADITNRFVADGVTGGLIALILSIILLTRCFQAIGGAMRELGEEDVPREKLLWGMGCTLTATIAILFSVTYFDQMHVIWYFLLAGVCACAFGEYHRVNDESEEELGEAPAVENARWAEVQAH